MMQLCRALTLMMANDESHALDSRNVNPDPYSLPYNPYLS